MSKKEDQSVPYIFEDDEMQVNFQRNFFRRPIARRRSFYLENFTSLPMVFYIFEFQGWNDLLRVSKDIYIGLVLTLYSTLVPTDEDNTSFRSIVGSFELQVPPSNIAQITNTLNEGIICRAGKRWWEELGATEEEVAEEEVAEVLTGKKKHACKRYSNFSFASSC